MAGLLHRTAQPLTLAAFRPWEGSAGAGRVRPAVANLMIKNLIAEMQNEQGYIRLIHLHGYPLSGHTPKPYTHFLFPSNFLL